jgi:hypothetical protein
MFTVRPLKITNFQYSLLRCCHLAALSQKSKSMRVLYSKKNLNLFFYILENFIEIYFTDIYKFVINLLEPIKSIFVFDVRIAIRYQKPFNMRCSELVNDDESSFESWHVSSILEIKVIQHVATHKKNHYFI